MLGDAQAVENNALQVSPSLTRRSHMCNGLHRATRAGAHKARVAEWTARGSGRKCWEHW